MYYGCIMVNGESYLKVKLETLLYTVLSLSFLLFFSLWTSWLKIGSLPCHKMFCCK